MSRKASTWELIHLALLSVLVGSLLMVGATAAVAFPAAKNMHPHLAGMDAYTGEHWILTAGGIMAPAFKIAAYVQYACIIGALIAFAFAHWPGGIARVRKIVLAREAVLLAIVLISAYQATILRPRMDRNLELIWSRARAGDDSGAGAARAAFDADHGPSRAVLEATLVLSLSGVVLACASAATTKRAERPA